MKAHFSRRMRRGQHHSQTVQEILESLGTSFHSFFTRQAKLPSKSSKTRYSPTSFQAMRLFPEQQPPFKNKIGKRFKFPLSRPYDWKAQILTLKYNNIGEFFIVMLLDKSP